MALKVEWHPYPEEKPTVEDVQKLNNFWVTLKDRNGRRVQEASWFDFNYDGTGWDFGEWSSWDEDDVRVPGVIAWAYFEEPEPYNN